MKIHSLKLTIQDTISKDKKPVAVLAGTVFIDEGKYKEDTNGPVLDKEGEKIPYYETINFVTSLDKNPEMKKHVQALLVEALTLKDMEIEKTNGTLSHFVRNIKSLGTNLPTKKK